MLLPTRAVVLEYHTGRWGGNNARFVAHYSALLDGKIERVDFHDRLSKLQVVAVKTSPPSWIPLSHTFLDLLLVVTGCALVVVDNGGLVNIVLPGMLILLIVSFVFRLCYLKCSLDEFREELTLLCTNFTALDGQKEGQGLVWKINGSPKWAWVYTIVTSWYTRENPTPFRIDVLICDPTDAMMKIDLDNITRKAWHGEFDFESEKKVDPRTIPSSPIGTSGEPKIIHTTIQVPSPPPPPNVPIPTKPMFARSFSLISKIGHRRNVSEKSFRTLPSTTRRHYRFLPRTPHIGTSEHDGYFATQYDDSVFSMSSKTSYNRFSTSSNFSNSLDGKTFLIVPMPTPPPEWPVSPEPPAIHSIAAEVIVPVLPVDDRNGNFFI